MATITPATRFKVGIPKTQITYIAKNVHLNYQDVLLRIRTMLNDLLVAILDDLTLWIKTYVPKRTGQLQENLIRHLESSTVITKGNLLRIVLGTNIDYAEAVNEMVTTQVRHMGEVVRVYYYGYHGEKIVLNDPEAVGHFFDELLKYAKERVLLLMTRYVEIYFGLPGKENVLIRHRIGMEAKT